jgi:ABC-2 type transport system permease protein
LNTLLGGMLLSGIVGVPGAITTVIGVFTFASWLRMPGVALIALVTGVVGAVTCVVASRAITAVSTGLSSGRRFREGAGLIIFIPLLLAGPIVFGISQGLRHSGDSLGDFAAAMSWTPLGAIWAVPSSFADGDPLGGVLRLLIGLATLAALLLLWRWGLARALVTPVHSSSRVRAQGKLGFFGTMPGTQTGAVAARSLTYWFRDPRYLRQLIIIPIFPALFWFYANLTHNQGFIMASGPAVGFLLGVSLIADVSYDSTAFALHISKAVPGHADRMGRSVAVVIFVLPVMIVICIGSAALQNSWLALPGLLGLSIGLLFSGLAVCCVTSTRLVIPVPAPGDSPFRSRPGSGLTTIGPTFASWGVLALLCLPEIALLVLSIVFQQVLWGWLGLAVGIALGLTLLAIGVRQGGRLLDHRAPELYVQLLKDA